VSAPSEVGSNTGNGPPAGAASGTGGIPFRTGRSDPGFVAAANRKAQRRARRQGGISVGPGTQAGRGGQSSPLPPLFRTK
jgi:hypothetical protein